MKTYTKKERNMYLVGLMGQNMIYNIITTGMAFYFQSVICLPAIAISTIMGIARIWDAINDPMMGTIVDRTRTKYGKCRPYLFVVPGIVCITTILTFVNGIYTHAQSDTQRILIIAWAGISYILWGMTYTAGDIPIWGITALMTENENDRSKLLGAARVVGGLGGAVVMLSLLSVSQTVGAMFDLGGHLKNQRMGFIIVCSAMTVIATVLFQCASYAKEKVEQPSDKKVGFVQNVKIMWACKPFRRLLISGVIKAPTQLLSIVAMTLLSFYFGDNSGNGQSYMLYMVILGGGMFGGMFGAMALVPKLCEKFEKKTLYNGCSIIGAIPFFLIFIAYLIDGTALYKPHWIAILLVLFAIAGAGTGISMVIQSIMIADCVDFDEHRTGYRPDGVFFSGQSFITKLGAGLSSFIQGIVFAAVGFSDVAMEECTKLLATSPADDFMFATDPRFEAYRFGLFFLVSIPAAVSSILSVIPMRKYELSNEAHKKLLEELNIKRNEKSA